MAIALAAVFSAMTSYGVTLTVLPYYASRIHALNGLDHGALGMHIGALTGVYALSQLLMGPVVGRVTDRCGRRPVALAGLLGVGTTQVVFGAVTSLPWLYALRVTGGIAASLLTVAVTAMLADGTDAASRTRGMAVFGTTVSLGIVAGPLVGLALNDLSLTIAGRTFDGYSLPFFLTGAVALLLAPLMWRTASAARSAAVMAAAGADRVGIRRLARGLMLVVAMQFSLALFEGTFVLYASERYRFSAAAAAQAFLVCGVMMAALQPFAAGPLRRALTGGQQIAIGFALMAAGTGGLLAVDGRPAVLGAVGVLATGVALVTPNLAALIAVADPGAVGRSLGWKTSASSLGQFLGPVVGTGLLAWRSDAAYAVTTAILLVAAGSSVVRRR